MLCVDFILCLVRSIINRPRQLLVQTAYAGVYATVQDQQCSASIREPMEIAQVLMPFRLSTPACRALLQALNPSPSFLPGAVAGGVESPAAGLRRGEGHPNVGRARRRFRGTHK